MGLQENLDRFCREDPEAEELFSQVDASTLTGTLSRSGEANLCDERGGRKLFLHSNYSSVKEMEGWFKELSLGGVKVLYVFGVGLGYAYPVVKPWLEEDAERYLVFIEDDLRVLIRLFESDLGEEILSGGQVKLYRGYPDSEHMEMLAQDLALNFVGLPFEVEALPHYKQHRESELMDFRCKMMHAAAYVQFAGQEFMNYGVAFFRNFYRNMIHLPEATGARSFFGALKNVPAIICGAGPSLNKNIDVLRQLEDRALIFAGGSAINALTCQGINPHFGGSIDPNVTQVERMRSHKGYELPVFIKGRTHHKAFEALQGPKIYLSGNNMYPLTLWLEGQLGLEEPQAVEGYNVLHLMIDLATRFGCNPIVFVGMDLAFTGLKSYADAVIDNASVSKEVITGGGDINSNAFVRPDIHGDPVHTLWKWVSESQYTSHYVSHHPETTYINATEGGIGFEGVQNRPLGKVAKEHFTRQVDYHSWVHQELQSGRFDGVTRKRILEQYCTLDESLEKCFHLVVDLVSAFDSLEAALKDGKKGQIQSASKKVGEIHHEFSSEIACQYILEPVNQVRSVIYDRKFSQIDYDREVRSDLERMLKRCEQNRQEMYSFKECIELNQALLREVLKEYASEIKEGIEL